MTLSDPAAPTIYLLSGILLILALGFLAISLELTKLAKEMERANETLRKG